MTYTQQLIDHYRAIDAAAAGITVDELVEARRKRDSEIYREMQITHGYCMACRLHHHIDDDCLAPPRHYFDGSQEP